MISLTLTKLLEQTKQKTRRFLFKLSDYMRGEFRQLSSDAASHVRVLRVQEGGKDEDQQTREQKSSVVKQDREREHDKPLRRHDAACHADAEGRAQQYDQERAWSSVDDGLVVQVLDVIHRISAYLPLVQFDPGQDQNLENNRWNFYSVQAGWNPRVLFRWVTGTDFSEDGFLARQEGVDWLKQKAEAADPQQDKPQPEIIQKCWNIFQLEDEQVPQRGDGIQKQQAIGYQGPSHEQGHQTKVII